jgi:hypothetical protein
MLCTFAVASRIRIFGRRVEVGRHGARSGPGGGHQMSLAAPLQDPRCGTRCHYPFHYPLKMFCADLQTASYISAETQVSR